MGVFNNQYYNYLATAYFIILLCGSPFPNSEHGGSIITSASAQDTTQGYTASVNFRFSTSGSPVDYAATTLSVYKVIVARPQDYSLGKIGITSVGQDNTVTASMEAGYIVFPERYGDNVTRFYVRWKNIANGNTTGCFDDDCPGFVRDERFGGLLGFNIASADPGEPARSAPTSRISISQENSAKNWVVELDGGPVGYWPNNLFTGVDQSVGFNVADLGGEVYDSTGDTTPTTQMGSGELPQAITGRGAYFRNTVISDVADNTYLVPNPRITGSASNPTCYGADFSDLITGVTGEPALLYGGPGCNSN